MAQVLIVEDEKLLRVSLSRLLQKDEHMVEAVGTLAGAVDFLRRRRPDLLILDLSLPDGHGLDFYERNRERLEGTVVVVMTAVGEVEDAVRAMKLGALDFLSKPFKHDSLVDLVNRSLQYRSDQLEAQLARQTRVNELRQDIIAESASFARTLEIAAKVASSEVDSVLIQGESGTGKNVVARHIHASSSRAGRPFLQVNCAAIPEQLLESELFGHERGAFTDAKQSKKGTFELADGGTVLLDEIGELKLGLQSKLLHFLEERTLRRVGGVREIVVDVRVIALTNRNLSQMVDSKQFRNDLFFRLNVFPITVPPLRDRQEDILPLARFFICTLQSRLGRSFTGLTRQVENILLSYPWPGNVRELRNVIERALILEKGPRISADSLILDTVRVSGAAEDGSPFSGIVPLEEVEREMVRRAMAAAGENQTRAAELLEITRDQLRYRLKKFGWPS